MGFLLHYRALKQAQESIKTLKKQNHDLKKENKRRDRLLSAMTHDLLTPLTVIKMSTQLLSKMGQSDIHLDLTKKIIESINRAESIIQDLLDANRVQSGQPLRLRIERCDLHEIARKTVDELSIIHGNRFQINTPAPLIGFWSTSGIQRIIENLGSNAAKYGDPQSPITINLKKIESNVTISVHNIGNPLTKSEQVRIFKPFCRTESAQRSGKQGWGLGLTLISGISEAHGGRVFLESSSQAGTIFTVSLPVDSRELSATAV